MNNLLYIHSIYIEYIYNYKYKVKKIQYSVSSVKAEYINNIYH